MTLRLRDFGIATAYATVGVGDVVPEMDVSRGAVSQFEQRNANRPGAKPELWPQEIVFLLGQADVASIYKTTNFKRVFELRYPRAESRASVVNWVFGVPFHGGRAADVDETRPFRFMIHLRLRRAVYAYRGIEEKIVNRLTELLGKRHASEARIHAGLGFSDLIVEGYFGAGASFRRVIDFIIQVHSLRITHGGDAANSIPVLQRILTVFGYREGAAPEFRHSRHVTFLRGVPGGYDDLIGLFGKRDRVEILDGKADFMVTTTKAPPDWLEQQRKLGDGTFKKFVRKVETHLMFFSAHEFAKRKAGANLDIDVGPDVLHEKECGCRDRAQPLIDDIENTIALLTDVDSEGRKRNLLPIEQRYAIDNALFLLGATLREPSICCDVRDAVLACFGGLLKILRHIDATPDESAAFRYEQMWKRLDEWHRLSELLLRQRTVGSYEEILGQTDRSIVYSGGVQKFLYLADQLMKDFARRVQPFDPPDFATIYDSVRSIVSFFRSGPLVRMPTSQIFGFPLIVPDLWHEVAGALFFLRFGESFGEVVRDRPDRNEFLENVADHYADTVVYLHGFRGDFRKFLVSLVHGWKLAYRNVPAPVWRVSVLHFLLRAYLVYEFDRIRAARRSGDTEWIRSFGDEEMIDLMVADLRDLLAERNLPPFDESYWKLLNKNVRTETFSDIHRQLYQPFVNTEVEPATETDLQPFLDGKIVDLEDADINALFGELAHYLAQNHPNKDAFAASAALGESAAIEYHRRQMTRRRSPSGESDAGG